MSEKNPFYGTTFAERKAIREGVQQVEAEEVDAKQVDGGKAENKAVKRTTARKKS